MLTESQLQRKRMHKLELRKKPVKDSRSGNKVKGGKPGITTYSAKNSVAWWFTAIGFDSFGFKL